MKPDKKQIEDLLFSYFSDSLTEEEEKALAQWLQADEAHLTQLAEMADWWAAAHVPRFVASRKSDFEKHFAPILKQSEPVVHRRMLTRSLWRMAVASVLLLAAVGSTAYYIGKSSVLPELEQVRFETVVPFGSQSVVILPDHSVVRMNAGSSLTYTSDFNAQTREVSLNGEAFFDVAKDSLKPFIVKSERLDIKVLGTRFNVKAYKDEQTVEVGLVSGKVNIHLNDHEPGTGEVSLLPDRRLSFDKETNKVQITAINGADAFAWTEGRLKFDEQPFERIAKDLERKYNVTIRIESELLKKQIYTGSFSATYSLNDILHEVNIDGRFAWRQNDTVFTVYDK